jgi:hypothetical protein
MVKKNKEFPGKHDYFVVKVKDVSMDELLQDEDHPAQFGHVEDLSEIDTEILSYSLSYNEKVILTF